MRRALWVGLAALSWACGSSTRSDSVSGAGRDGAGGTGGSEVDAGGDAGRDSLGSAGDFAAEGGSPSAGANTAGSAASGRGGAAGRAGSDSASGSAGRDEPGGAGGAPEAMECLGPIDCFVPETDPPNCAWAECALGECRVFGQDRDGDGAGAFDCVSKDPRFPVLRGNDCDDGDPAIRPFATELCNGVDDDCDGVVDAQHGTADTSPRAPGAELSCFEGNWYVIAWQQDFTFSPAAPDPLGVCSVSAIRFLDSTANPVPSPAVPPILFRVERLSTSDAGDLTRIRLDFDVLASLSPAQQREVADRFSAAGIIQLDLRLPSELTLSVSLPGLGAPLRLNRAE